jgi:hypothetical protein
MTFIITLVYGAALFGAGLWFIRRGKRTHRQNTDLDGHSDQEIQSERRGGRDRRGQPAALSQTP